MKKHYLESIGIALAKKSIEVDKINLDGFTDNEQKIILENVGDTYIWKGNADKAINAFKRAGANDERIIKGANEAFDVMRIDNALKIYDMLNVQIDDKRLDEAGEKIIGLDESHSYYSDKFEDLKAAFKLFDKTGNKDGLKKVGDRISVYSTSEAYRLALEAYMKAGKKSKAIKLAEEAFKEKNYGVPLLIKEELDKKRLKEMGDECLENGASYIAVTFYKAAGEENESEIYVRMGDTLLKNGQRKKAIKAYEKSGRLKELEKVGFDYLSGEYSGLRGTYKEALNIFERTGNEKMVKFIKDNKLA